METRTDQPEGRSAGREGIRGVLLGQYAFHEAPHHSQLAAGVTGHVQTVPIAHTLADIYKCLHQGEFGVGHSLEDPNNFAAILARELAEAQPNSSEPVLENVSGSGLVFRVNLRPYRHKFANREKVACMLLAQACVKSAEVYTGTGRNFIAALEWFKDLNNSGELVVNGRAFMFPSKAVEFFFDQAKGFMWSSGSIPVLGHSAIYKQHNAPTYRVVDRMTLEQSDLAFLLQEYDESLGKR